MFLVALGSAVAGARLLWLHSPGARAFKMAGALPGPPCAYLASLRARPTPLPQLSLCLCHEHRQNPSRYSGASAHLHTHNTRVHHRSQLPSQPCRSRHVHCAASPQQQGSRPVSFGLSIQTIPDLTVEDHLPSHQHPSHKHTWTKPYMLLLPDLDGVGITSAKRWPTMATGMDLQVLKLDTAFQGTVTDLIHYIQEHLARTLADMPPERPTFLLGEGFGSVLALAVMLECREEYINRVVLVNPITSVKNLPLKQITPLLGSLPSNVMQVSPLALLQLLGSSPPELMTQLVARAARQGPGGVASTAMQVLFGAVEQLNQLTRHLPPATLTARLALLDQALEMIEGRLDEVETRTMILAGGRDYLPSEEEAKRLANLLPRAFVKVVADAGHALLQDPGFDLLAVMREEGFLVERRRFTSPLKPGTKLAFGAAGPIELPSHQEVARAGAQLTAPLRQMCSPVFLSTLPDGTIVEGLAGLDVEHRPLLFVGNHQLFAMDMNLLVEEVYLQKGILLRGLAHPALFTNTASGRRSMTPKPSRAQTPQATDQAAGTPSAQDGQSRAHVDGPQTAPAPRRMHQGAMNNAVPVFGTLGSQSSRPSQQQARASPPPVAPVTAPLRLGDLYRTFGAVIVTPTSFFKLLACGECVLLYPGGVREGFKRRDEKYELFWPEKGEFVRMAARHGAWVVPVSAVGWEDSINIVMDTDEIAKHPLLGAAARAASDATPRARDGSASDVDETFIPPLIAPAMPERLYFLLGRPVQLTRDLASDKGAADDVYRQIKGAVQDGIAWLLEQREQDPFRQLLTRLVYENLPVLGRKHAPTFPLQPRTRSPTPKTQEPRSRLSPQ